MGKITKKFEGVRQRGKKYEWRAEYMGVKAGKSGYDTPEKAYIARMQWLDDAKAGYAVKPTKAKVFVDVWEEATYEPNVYADSSIKRRMSLLNNHIEPYFGHRLIASITAGDIERFLLHLGVPTKDKKFGKPKKYSQEYINGFFKAIAATMQYAYKNRYIPFDPTLQVNKRGAWKHCGREKEEGKLLSPAQLRVIGGTMSTTNLYTSYMIALHTGARISEIFGIRWDDVNFERNEIHLNKQLTYLDEDADGNVYKMWKLSPMKSVNSDRYVPMTKELREYLLNLKEVQEADKAKMGSNYRDKEKPILFETENGQLVKTLPDGFVNVKSTGEFLTPDSTKYATREREESTGKYRFLLNPEDESSSISFSYHDFRHTYATLLALNGMPCKDLQALMGHAKADTTKKFYIHDSNGRLRVNPVRDEFLFDTFSALSKDIENGEVEHTSEKIEGITPEIKQDAKKPVKKAKTVKEEIPVLSDILKEFKNGIGYLK